MDWSYVAGYFDGEGHVSLHRCKNGNTMRCLSWYNTHLGSLEAMRDFMGCGKIGARNRTNRTLPAYALVVGRKVDMLKVLDGMIPHLIVKKEAAEKLRQFLSTVGEQSPNFGKIAAVSDDQLKRWYYDEGKSCTEIGGLVGVGRTAVYQALKSRGFPLRPNGGHHMKGKAKSEETKQRMRESRQKMWEDPEFRATQIASLKKGRNAWLERRKED
jgi:hypothetical protein